MVETFLKGRGHWDGQGLHTQALLVLRALPCKEVGVVGTHVHTCLGACVLGVAASYHVLRQWPSYTAAAVAACSAGRDEGVREEGSGGRDEPERACAVPVPVASYAAPGKEVSSGHAPFHGHDETSWRDDSHFPYMTHHCSGNNHTGNNHTIPATSVCVCV